MSRAQSSGSGRERTTENVSEQLEVSGSSISRDPKFSLDYESAENLVETQGVFNPDLKRLNRIMGEASGNVYSGPESSARILENYIGQFSGGELEDFIPSRFEDMQEDIRRMNGTIVLGFDYLEDGGYENQYLDREGGKVSREVLEILDEEAEESDVYLRFFETGEDDGWLVIGN